MVKKYNVTLKKFKIFQFSGIFESTFFFINRRFVHVDVFHCRRFVSVDGRFPFDVLSHSAFFLSTFCPSTFLTLGVFYFDVLSVYHIHIMAAL
jgi:hypothetical protein